MNASSWLERSHSVAQAGPRVFMILMGFAASGASALEPDLSTLAGGASPDEARRVQLQVTGSSLPRFDNIDGSNRSSRIDLTLLPPRRSALGPSVGLSGPDANTAFYPAGSLGGSAPTIDVGLRWRYTLDSNYRIDVAAWRRLMPTDALTLVQMHEPTYGARVEMQIAPVPKSGFVANKGFIGFQLESGARVTLRRSGGKPMIYYRTKF